MEYPSESEVKVTAGRQESIVTDQSMLHDADSERSLLGALMWNSERFYGAAEYVSPSSFYFPKHARIFEAMTTLSQKGDAIDSVTVAAQLTGMECLEGAGGREYLLELVDQSPSTAHVETYAKIIQEKYLRRRLMQASSAINEHCVKAREIEEIIDSSEKELFEVTQQHVYSQYKGVGSIVPNLVDEILSVSDGGQKHRGISTGYDKLDDRLSGFHPSDLIILAARPSVGKTALALDIARRTATKHNTSIGIFSLEMSSSQLIERFLSAESRLDAWRMRTGRIKEAEDLDALTTAADRLSKLNIYIDDRSAMSTLNIRSTARRMKREHDIQLLIVDYLQLITPYETRRSDSMVQHITEVSRALKQTARELKIPVVALSQLSRDIEKRDGKPRLSDLRDSGSIEQDADVVMFLHRKTNQMYEGDETAPIPTDLLIEKHRNGPTGRVALQFDRKFATYVEPVNDSMQDDGFNAVGM